MNITQVEINTQVDIKINLVQHEYEAIEYLASGEDKELSEWITCEFKQYLINKIKTGYKENGLNWKEGKVFSALELTN